MRDEVYKALNNYNLFETLETFIRKTETLKRCSVAGGSTNSSIDNFSNVQTQDTKRIM